MNRDESLSSIISEQADRQFRELVEQHTAGADSGSAAIWRSVEESALSLALVPDELGGAGLAPADAFEIVRLAGYRGLPLPLGDTQVAKALWSDAGGELSLTGDGPVLLAAGRGGGSLSLRRSGGLLALTGDTGPVACGDAPASLLVQARAEDGEAVLLLLDASAARFARRPSTGFEDRGICRFEGLAVDPARCRGAGPQPELALQAHGAFVRSMLMVGAMQRCVELGLQYASERSQFGRPIARFAPVQDMLVEAAAETAAALASAGLALEHWQLRPTPTSLFCIAGAKSRCGEAAGKVSALIHQVHGAIGFTQEHVLHRFTRRLWAWRDEFGTESAWNRWLGEQVAAGSGAELWPRISSL